MFNPVWTYPDGLFTWVEALRDEEKIGLHAALTPTWNETAYFADYVLPMGHASERHDIISYETHLGHLDRFPPARPARGRGGAWAIPVTFTYEANPGEVWEEDEFWIELSWRIDPDGSLGIRDHFISPYRPGEKITVDEYYRYIFDHVDGLPEAAAKEGLSPLDYMRKYGAFEVEKTAYAKHLRRSWLTRTSRARKSTRRRIPWSPTARPWASMVDGTPRAGFPTPSLKQEFYSQTMVDWGWPEYAIPTYIKSHVHPDELDREKGEFPLVPTFRLPTLIHSRSGNAKWLNEISNRNPVWMHRQDADLMGITTGDLVRVTTEIGHFVDRVWVTEAMKPGVVACSHHLGRWRRKQDADGNRWSVNLVDIQEASGGKWRMKVMDGIRPYESADRDSSRIFWRDGGVHQNITFPVHPDPVSGMHCWHQKVRVEKAREEDAYGDVMVDTEKSFEVYRAWLDQTRPAPGPGGLRRPLWLNRPLRPAEETYYLPE